MITGVEPLYQRIADSIEAAIEGDWQSATVEVVFYSKGPSYRNRCIPVDRNGPQGFFLDQSGCEAFDEIRELFRRAGKPLWCRAQFDLSSDGKFNMKWGYNDCDENGFARFNEEEYIKRMQD